MNKKEGPEGKKMEETRREVEYPRAFDSDGGGMFWTPVKISSEVSSLWRIPREGDVSAGGTKFDTHPSHHTASHCDTQAGENIQLQVRGPAWRLLAPVIDGAASEFQNRDWVCIRNILFLTPRCRAFSVMFCSFQVLCLVEQIHGIRTRGNWNF